MSSIATSPRRCAARLLDVSVFPAGADPPVSTLRRSHAAADRPARPAPPGASSNTLPAAASAGAASSMPWPAFSGRPFPLPRLGLGQPAHHRRRTAATSCALWVVVEPLPPATTAFSRSGACSLRLARPGRMVFDHLVLEGPALAGDDTVDEQERRSSARAATATRSAPRTPSPCSAGAQVGRADRAGPLPWARRLWRCRCWWRCIAVRRTTKPPAPQDAGAIAPTTLLCAAALVPTAAVRAQRRRQLWLARDGAFRVPAPGAPAWSASSTPMPGCQPPPPYSGTTGRGSKGPSCPRRSRW